MRPEAADATAPIDVVMRLRCAPIARDATELAAQLARLLREKGAPPVRVRPMRFLIRPASSVLTAHGTLPTVGGDRAEEAIVLVVRVMPGRVPGEVSHVDAAASLMRLPEVTLAVAIGATLAAPLTATLAVSKQRDASSHGASSHRSGSTALVAAANSGGYVSSRVEDAEHVVPASQVGQATAEEGRAHAAHTLLHYVRSLERGVPPLASGSDDDPTLAVSLPEPEVGKPELVASLSVLLPLIREALYAARLSSSQQREADAAAGDHHAWHHDALCHVAQRLERRIDGWL